MMMCCITLNHGWHDVTVWAARAGGGLIACFSWHWPCSLCLGRDGDEQGLSVLPHCLTCSLPKGRVGALLSFTERLQLGSGWASLGMCKPQRDGKEQGGQECRSQPTSASCLAKVMQSHSPWIYLLRRSCCLRRRWFFSAPITKKSLQQRVAVVVRSQCQWCPSLRQNPQRKEPGEIIALALGELW